MEGKNEILRENMRHLPRSPGVYLFKNSSGRVIYVGKALDLRQRVRSYFQKAPSPSARLKALVNNIHELSYIVTDTEEEAFILESNLIKEHAPRYNVQFKDDKQYPYLRLTTGETFPRLEVARKVEDRESRYFGPYSNAGAVRDTLRLIKKLFPLRSCRHPFGLEGSGSRPCLNFQIGRCLAPCRGEVLPEEYGRVVEQVSLFLEGRQSFLLQKIHQEMQDAAEKLEFEKASRLRDQYFSLQKIMERQKVVSSDLKDRDAVALVPLNGGVTLGVFRVRGGKLLGSEYFIPQETAGADENEIMKEFLRHYYKSAFFVPGEVLVSHSPSEKELLEDWLGQKRKRKVHIRVPQRGEKKALLELAGKNALAFARQEEERRCQGEEVLEELARLLGLPDKPERIEGYDISHFAGTETVGSMVVFNNGEPSPEEYRRFSIRSAKQADDYAALVEVLERRFGARNIPLPSLMLIDGGRGQLSAALSVLQDRGLGEKDGVFVTALAKEREHLFLPEQRSPLALPGFHPALKLLQRVRDEAHRFALSYSRSRSAKSSLASYLESIPGIGPRRRKALLQHFGSLDKLKGASLEEINTVDGMDIRSAQNLYRELHAGDEKGN